MQEKYRLKKRSDFRRVFNRGRSFANRQFVIYTCQRKMEGPFRIGISVSRKVGNSVVRNRLKRVVKEITRNWASFIKTQIDFVVIIRKPAVEVNYKQMKASLRHLFNKSKVFHNLPPQEDKMGE